MCLNETFLSIILTYTFFSLSNGSKRMRRHVFGTVEKRDKNFWPILIYEFFEERLKEYEKNFFQANFLLKGFVLTQ